ncbi:MAG: winged helix-turn-helix domain-containing protein [Micromonosporaceae bacterium]
MTVPDYQSLMVPALHALADDGERSSAELRRLVAIQIGLTDDDLRATIPSGAPLFANRLHWAITSTWAGPAMKG